MKINAALMCQNELSDLKQNVEYLLSFVDTVTVVDGGSSDQTIFYMRNWASIEPRIRFFLHPWEDNFVKQRNNYLAHIKEIAIPGDWIICLDPDEFLMNAKTLVREVFIPEAERRGINIIGFRCRSVSLKAEKRTWENEDDYWKRFLIKWDPNFHYSHGGEMPVHESYAGIPMNIWDPGRDGNRPHTLWYEHRKQENIIWPKGCRNYFCSGSGPNLGSSNPRWVELRNLCRSINIDRWHDFYNYMVKGNIDQRIKDWMIKYRLEDGWDGSSEQRECYKTYFRLLHAEEEPEQYKGEYIK